MDERQRLRQLHAERMARYRKKKRLREWDLVEREFEQQERRISDADRRNGREEVHWRGGQGDDDDDGTGEEEGHHQLHEALHDVDDEPRELLRDDGDDNHLLELEASPVQPLPPVENLLASPVVMGEDYEMEEEMGDEQQQQQLQEHGDDVDMGEDAWLHAPGRLQDGDDAEFKDEVGDFFASITAGGSCTKTAAQTMFQFCALHAEDFVRAKRRGIRMKSLQHLLDKTYMRVSPTVVTDLFVMQDRVQVRIASVQVYTKRLQYEPELYLASQTSP